jgi:lysophospholipase L1-like esterase
MKRPIHLAALPLVLLSLVCATRAGAEPVLRAGDKVAITGDSITEQRKYSVYIEAYLLACKPAGSDVRVMQFGWSGDTSWGFLGRIDNDCLQFKPTLVTTCFGMNDGGYAPLTPEVEAKYRKAMTGVADAIASSGARGVLGSPGCVDTNKFRNSPEMAAMYNKTLAAERDIVREIAREKNMAFANVHDAMIDAMGKAKAKFGPDYHVAGADGFHPSNNGHLVMAYAFLKALGCDGEIGTITVDLASNGGGAKATDGHTVVGFDKGVLTLKSVKYPFCFPVGEKFSELSNPINVRGMLDCFPFNEDLNRFRLVVRNAPPNAKVKVTWGDASKTFAAEQLAQGVNLAAEFLDNPFSEKFRILQDAVQKKQAFETPMIKSLVHVGYFELPEEKDLNAKIVEATSRKQKALSDQAAQIAAEPVEHTIRIEVEK